MAEQTVGITFQVRESSADHGAKCHHVDTENLQLGLGAGVEHKLRSASRFTSIPDAHTSFVQRTRHAALMPSVASFPVRDLLDQAAILPDTNFVDDNGFQFEARQLPLLREARICTLPRPGYGKLFQCRPLMIARAAKVRKSGYRDGRPSAFQNAVCLHHRILQTTVGFRPGCAGYCRAPRRYRKGDYQQVRNFGWR